MTLNGVMAVILRYFSEFGSFRGALRKSSRSLSHLLMSSCYFMQSVIRKVKGMNGDCYELTTTNELLLAVDHEPRPRLPLM